MRISKMAAGIFILLALIVFLPGMALADTAIEDEGDFVLLMEESSDEDYQAVRDVLLEQGRFDELVELLNQLALPDDITIHFREGNPGDAYYDPGDRKIVLSYDFAALIYTVFTESGDEYYSDDEDLILEAAIDTLEAVLFHEAGHALIDVLEIPVTGMEEDSVDALSAYMLVFILKEPDIVVSAADFYDIMSLHTDEITDEDMWDEHALNDQRYYNLICWSYGSDPEEFEYLLEESGMGDDRARRCEEEYEQIVKSWSVLLGPYIKE